MAVITANHAPKNYGSILGEFFQEQELMASMRTDLPKIKVILPGTDRTLVTDCRLWRKDRVDISALKILMDESGYKLCAGRHNNLGIITLKVFENRKMAHWQELEMLKTLKNNHIVNCLGAFLGSKPVLVLEPVFGTVKSIICTAKFSDGNILKLAHHVAQGLRYLHGQNIIHCDVNPKNIMVTPESKFVIGNFENAERVDEGRTIKKLCRHDIPHVGDILYQNVEAVINNVFSRQTDLFGLACTIFYCETSCNLTYPTPDPPSDKNISAEVVANLSNEFYIRSKIEGSRFRPLLTFILEGIRVSADKFLDIKDLKEMSENHPLTEKLANDPVNPVGGVASGTFDIRPKRRISHLLCSKRFYYENEEYTEFIWKPKTSTDITLRMACLGMDKAQLRCLCTSIVQHNCFKIGALRSKIAEEIKQNNGPGKSTATETEDNPHLTAQVESEVDPRSAEEAVQVVCKELQSVTLKESAMEVFGCAFCRKFVAIDLPTLKKHAMDCKLKQNA